MIRFLIWISLFFLASGYLSLHAQPPKSYKKQMKQKAKSGQSSDDLMEKAMDASKIMKKFKDKLKALDKDIKDAEASSDAAEVEKIEFKIRLVKGDMFRARDKIEKKMIKDYQKINDKETRKRMKKNKKKSGRVNAGKKPSLWQRLRK